MAVAAGQVHREVKLFERQFAPPRREDVSYRRQPGPPPREAAWNQRQPGPFGPGPSIEAFQNDGPPDEDSLWMAGQVLTLADDQAAEIEQEARDHAAAIREAAEREAAAITQLASNRAEALTEQATGQAAAIRQAAEREAAELRARLDSMADELSRVVTAYLNQSLTAPALPTTAAPLPEALPLLPRRTRPALDAPADADASATQSAPPAARPAAPEAIPGNRPARPAKPRTAPAGPRTTPKTAPTKPGGKSVPKEQRLGRQKRAMRIAQVGTAAMLLLAIGGAGLEMHHNGYNFFVFRENGQGDSPSSGPGRVGVDQVDSQFLAAQAAARAKAAHHAPGRHAKTSPSSTATTAARATGG